MKIMYTAVALPAAEQKWPLQRNTASCKRWTWCFLPFPFVTFHGTYLIQNTFYKAYFKASIPFSRSPFKSSPCSLQVFDHSRQLREKMSLFSLPLRVPTPQCWNNFHSAATPSSTWNLPLFCTEATGSSGYPRWFGAWCLPWRPTYALEATDVFTSKV